jgi:class 3 adenylate cyclase/tetratricopeptide (TPR) repeat protein
MKCPRCQHDNRPGAKFCEECAVPLAGRCNRCGAELRATAKFCPECAHPTGIAPLGPAAPRLASPESYVPKHLAERILTSKAALEGERKQVTVLFADLKSSMELLADRDPEEARKILDPVLELMMEAVHRYEGTVNQVMGDGIMALFGAPLAHEDHAVRACYAALRMQESIARYADGVFRSQGIPIQIRVGLNSGDVVVRAIGSDLRMDYTAVGLTTHLAARMEQMATPGTTLLAPATLLLAEGYVEVTALGPTAVKGLPEPLEIHRLTGASAQRTRLHATAARGLAPFVGREAEIDLLDRALARARDGRGQLVAIVGEPGVGKSRLLHELTQSPRAHEWLVLQTGAASHGTTIGYAPVIDLLKSYFRVDDQESHRDIRDKVAGKLFGLDRALEPILPALLALLDVPVDDREWPALDPSRRRERTLEAVKRLLLREAQEQPILVVFEDLHWIDAQTQAVLDALVESLPTARILLLVNYRPEYEHRWGSRTFYTQIRLDPLATESALELLKGLLGDRETIAALGSTLIERTDGNPFFLEETIRALAETGTLAGERGRYRLTKSLDEIQVPATVQAIIAARIDRLSPEDKRLLQSAAVIGKDVAGSVLAALAAEGDEDLRRGLARLQAAEFLYEVRLFPEPEYTFKHALTHEVAYAALLHDRRRELHARVLTVMEELYEERRAEHVDELARHALRAHAWEAGARYCVEAASRAGTRGANRDAARLFEQGLDALGRMPESTVGLSTSLDILIELRTVYWRLNQVRRSSDATQRAEELAHTLGDRWRLARIRMLRVAHLFHFGEHARALQAASDGLAIATELGDLRLLSGGHFFSGWANHSLGNHASAVEHIDRALSFARRLPPEEQDGIVPLFFLQMYSAWFRAETGEFAEGRTDGEDAARTAESRGHRYGVAASNFHLGELYLRQGDLTLAERVLEHSLQAIHTADLEQVYPYTAARLGLTRVLLGKPDSGLPLLEEAVRVATRDGTAESTPALTMLGEAYLGLGRHDDARDMATRARAIALARGERGYEAWTDWLRGASEARSSRGSGEDASTYYARGLALADALGMRPLVAHCHMGLGELYRGTGDSQQAAEHFSAARKMYREMGMTYWLGELEQESTRSERGAQPNA